MNAISSVFSIELSFCLWHMKRAVLFKNKIYNELNGLSINVDMKTSNMSIMTRNYNQHSVISFCDSIEAIRTARNNNLRFLDSSLSTNSFL